MNTEDKEWLRGIVTKLRNEMYDLEPHLDSDSNSDVLAAVYKIGNILEEMQSLAEG